MDVRRRAARRAYTELAQERGVRGRQPEPTRLLQLARRAAARDADPREYVLAAFDAWPAHVCRTSFRQACPPWEYICSPAGERCRDAWAETRVQLYVDPGVDSLAERFAAAVGETEYRLGLAGGGENAVRVGLYCGFLRPEWIATYPERIPAELDLDQEYGPADLRTLAAIAARATASKTFRDVIARARR